MLDFKLDFWDYATFIALALTAAACVAAFVWLAGLPGRIAVSRKHPDAEAVTLMGWAGLLPTILPWIQAFIWAYKPTNVVDIRRLPSEEAEFIDALTERLSGKAPQPAAKDAEPARPARDDAAPARPDASASEGTTR